MHPLLTASLVCFILFFSRYLYSSKKRLPLPPGPRGWPIIGNLFDMPQDSPWQTFSQWGQKYGEIASVTVFGQPVVVLNSVKTATEFLGHKSQIYSNRTESSPTGEYVGWKDTLPFLLVGNTFRQYRKLWHQEFGTPAAMKKYQNFEDIAVRKFLHGLGTTSQDLTSLIKMFVVDVSGFRVTLGITYGLEVSGPDDEAIPALNRAMQQFANVTTPNAALVNRVPFLRYIPSWLPGGGFFKKGELSVEALHALFEAPYAPAKTQVEAGLNKKCLLSSIYKPDLDPDEDHIIKWATASIAAPGFSTRLSSIHAFFLTMALNPDIQRCAQAEIDAVVGTDRLPSLDDRDKLPYVNAVCREVLRFHSVVPTGLPHVALQDNIHDGYMIPKGSIVITNIWNMLRDPRTYSDPDTFNPSRFIPSAGRPAEQDVYDFIFGFGRRVCPGRVLADTSLFILAAMTLATFDVSKSVDQDGITVMPVMKPLNGSVSQLAPFKCSVKLRSAEALALIVSHYD